MNCKTIHPILNWAIIFQVLLIMAHCKSDDDLSSIPKIHFIQLTKSSLIQGDFFQDSLRLVLQFEDGDGDLGFPVNDSRFDITLFDSRNNKIQDQYKLPTLPDSEGRPQRGTLQLLVFTSCCLFKDQIPPCTAPPQYPIDSLFYKIILRDKAGHVSDTAVSSQVYLQCL